MLIRSWVLRSGKNYPIPGSALPKIIPKVTAKRMTAIHC